jgi:hypothetical protein
MGFKVKQKQKGAEVKIIRAAETQLVGKFGIIQRISLNNQTAFIKLTNENIEVEIPLNDIIIP